MLARAFAALTVVLAFGASTADAEWTPAKWADANTIQLRTTRAGEGEHWFPVWLVVLDDQVYVRLGARAAKRIADNTTAPLLDARIDEQQFRVKGVESPGDSERVAQAMAKKYWSDVVIRYFDHPLTLKLVPQ